MNPFFWIMVLIAMVAAWFGLRGMFIKLGSEVADVLQDTKDILNSDGAVEENFNENMEEKEHE